MSMKNKKKADNAAEHSILLGLFISTIFTLIGWERSTKQMSVSMENFPLKITLRISCKSEYVDFWLHCFPLPSGNRSH